MAENNLNWIPAAAGAAMGAIGMLGQKQREERQLGYQKQLMDIQMANQANLNKQGADLQYEMWQKTNYPAQMAMLKEAGLNPALLYGKSGSGGTTTGSQGGGSATGGSAPQVPSVGMDIQNSISAMNAIANLNLVKAQTKKVEAEASNIKGESGTIGESTIRLNLAQAEKLLEDKLNAQAQRDLLKLEYRIGYATAEDQIEKAILEVDELAYRNDLTREQTEVAKTQVLAMGAKIKLDQAHVELAEHQIWKITQDVIQRGQELQAEYSELEIKNQANKLRALEGNTRILENDTRLMDILARNRVEWAKLSQEQQKVFAKMFGDILGTGGSIFKETLPKRY